MPGAERGRTARRARLGNVRLTCPLMSGPSDACPGEGRGVRMVRRRRDPEGWALGARPSDSRQMRRFRLALAGISEISAIAMKMLTAAAPQFPVARSNAAEKNRPRAASRKSNGEPSMVVTPSVEAIASRTIHPWVRGRGDENSVSVVCFGPSSRPMAPIEEVAPR